MYAPPTGEDADNTASGLRQAFDSPSAKREAKVTSLGLLDLGEAAIHLSAVHFLGWSVQGIRDHAKGGRAIQGS
jgi:hypothetical protein